MENAVRADEIVLANRPLHWTQAVVESVEYDIDRPVNPPREDT